MVEKKKINDLIQVPLSDIAQIEGKKVLGGLVVGQSLTIVFDDKTFLRVRAREWILENDELSYAGTFIGYNQTEKDLAIEKKAVELGLCSQEDLNRAKLDRLEY